MAEIEFADGQRVVDDVYVEPIHRVTDGSPERFPFQVVMDKLGDAFLKDRLRAHQAAVVREHLRQWG